MRKMKRLLRTSALCFAGLLAMSGIAHADRYVIQFGDLPNVYSGDSTEYLLSLEPQAGMLPPTPVTLATITVPAAAPNPGATVPPEGTTMASTALTEPTPRLQGQTCDMMDAAAPMGAPYTSDAAFMSALSAVYSITVPAEIQQVYNWYTKEPTGLTTAERVGNGVVKFIMASDKPPTGDANSRPDLLKPQSTGGTVRSANGVAVRAAPWGGPGGAALPSGAALQIVPPANGPWYQLRSGGWVCGLWVNLN